MATLIFAIFVALSGLNVLVTIARVGKPRATLTSNDAIAVTVVSALMILGYVYIWRH